MDRPRDSRARPRPALIGFLQQGLAGLRRVLRPPRTLRPTRAGWIFFLLTFGVGFAALNTGNNLLYLVLAFMLSFLVLSGVLSESSLRGMRVRRRLPREIVARASAPVVLEIRNENSRVPAYAVVVEDLAPRRASERAGPALGRVFVLRVGPGRSQTRIYGLVAPHRGRFGFGGYRVSTRFPFGLFSKSLVMDDEQEALVFPEIHPTPADELRGSEARVVDGAAHSRGPGIEATGLREFVPGDSMRRIHWRSSLRRRALFVREADDPHEAEIELRLRTEGVDPGDDFEARVRKVASEAHHLLERGLRVALRTDDELLEAHAGTKQRSHLLGFLALVAPRPREELPA